jgi:uncharacterized pyridoxal phosphate-dependent enzyme
MDIYSELGVEKIINASGTVTTLGGSLMLPAVVEAMSSAARNFVDIVALRRAAGRRIAGLVGVEAAHVTAGAAAGITVMAAACMAGSDPARIDQLPDTTDMKHRFVVQRTHRNGFDRALLLAGGSFLTIEPDADELREALTGDIAGVFYTQAWFCDGPSLDLPQVCRIAHAAGVPVIVDAAAKVPPRENLRRFVEEGADLVVFSGGKMLRGPQASGVVVGRTVLVNACEANDCPNTAVGRGMKCGKEEIVGLVKAIEIFVSEDRNAARLEWTRRVEYITRELSNIEHVCVEARIHPETIPFAVIRFDPPALSRTYQAVADTLKNGDPAIAIQVLPEIDEGDRLARPAQIRVHPHTLAPGEAEVVGKRLAEALADIDS